MSKTNDKSGKLTHLAGKTFTVVDKVLGSIGSVADTINKVAPSVIDESAKVIDAHLEKHKADFKMPGLTGLTLAEAKRILETYQLQYALVLMTPSPKLANAHPDIVLSTTPKEKSKVGLKTFVRVYYVTEAVILASQQIIDDQQTAKANAKAKKQATHRQQLKQATDTAKSLSTGALTGLRHLTKKTAKKSKTKDDRIDITDSAVESEPESSTTTNQKD